MRKNTGPAGVNLGLIVTPMLDMSFRHLWTGTPRARSST
jgi:hypothetical protein